MKKMTFAVWFAALLSVFSLSSCLDGDDNAVRQASEIVKVTGYMGFYSFESAAGYTIVPRNQSAFTESLDSRYAYIAYSYNSGDVTQNMKKINVDLLGAMPIKENYIHELDQTAMDEYANAPIRNITSGVGYEFFPITFWDPKTMFLPINYFIKNVASTDELKKEVLSHSFEIYFDVDDPAADNGDYLILHVRHRVDNPELNKERNARINTDIFHVDLTYPLARYKEKHNNQNPSLILVEYEGSSTGNYVNERGEKYVESIKAEINYSEIVSNYEQNQQYVD